MTMTATLTNGTTGWTLQDGEDGPQSLVWMPEGATEAETIAVLTASRNQDAPTTAERLEIERAGMVVSALQGRLALGESGVAALDALAAHADTPWATKEAIKNASEWRRLSPLMVELGAALKYTPAQMDKLFRAAKRVQV